jgi:hypothetical protein
MSISLPDFKNLIKKMDVKTSVPLPVVKIMAEILKIKIINSQVHRAFTK